MADDPKVARIIKVDLKDNIRLVGVTDPEANSGEFVKMDVDFTGLFYGWNLQPIMEKAPDASIPFTFPAEVKATANAADDPKDQNTVALQLPELIKLDCGYWGEYLRGGKRKHFRDFGLIQGSHVYQCAFVPQGSQQDYDEKIVPKTGPMRKFLEAFKGKDFCVRIARYAHAATSPATSEVDPNLLYFILPDLHLPERWPDEPAAFNRKSDGSAFLDVRTALQAELICCQHDVGWKWFVDMDYARQRAIQDYLQDVIVNKNMATGWTVTVTRKFRSDLTYTFTASEFLAELAYVDRRIKAAMTWFYGEGLTQDQRMKGAKPDDLAPLDRHLSGNPSPAIDLINVLAILKKVKGSGEAIQVVQLGDLLEMWIGREFLYRFFPVCDKPLEGNAPTALSLVTGSLGMSDELQGRRDTGWERPARANPTSFKHYVFDKADKAELLERHKTGSYTKIPAARGGMAEKAFYEAVYHQFFQLLLKDHEYGWDDESGGMEDLGRAIVSRLQTLCRQRFHNTWNFCMPIPLAKNLPSDEGNALNSAVTEIKKIEDGAFLQRHKRTAGEMDTEDEHAWSVENRVQWMDHSNDDLNGEFYWNRMILTLLQDMGFVNIHGNHDGYRSDPLLNAGLPGDFQARETYESAKPGVWFEHGHRWDCYNRDGRFFGAGMTNMVYYHFDGMISADEGHVKKWFTDPAEQASEQPGAAQWFRIVNFLPAKQKPGFEHVKPFGIYVSGHTHAADLVRMVFHTPAEYEEEMEREAHKYDNYGD